MRLSQEQLAQFEREGYLFFPSLFSSDEMKVLRDEVPSIYKEFRPEIIREKDGLTPRTSFAA
ncbi:MAG: proline hydroxylase, partial [Betaproteobacteria bacterium]|nr:proline hydroxylase [Betaproteobacteria bacterium]